MSSKSIEFYSKFNWRAVPYREVQAGDLLANHATVTKVVHGPHDGKNTWDTVAKGEVRIECGKGFSTKSLATNAVVIGTRMVEEDA